MALEEEPQELQLTLLAFLVFHFEASCLGRSSGKATPSRPHCHGLSTVIH